MVVKCYNLLPVVPVLSWNHANWFFRYDFFPGYLQKNLNIWQGIFSSTRKMLLLNWIYKSRASNLRCFFKKTSVSTIWCKFFWELGTYFCLFLRARRKLFRCSGRAAGHSCLVVIFGAKASWREQLSQLQPAQLSGQLWASSWWQRQP